MLRVRCAARYGQSNAVLQPRSVHAPNFTWSRSSGTQRPGEPLRKAPSDARKENASAKKSSSRITRDYVGLHRAPQDAQSKAYEDMHPGLAAHLQRQERASLYDLDIPSAVAAEAKQKGMESAPPNVSLSEANARIQKFLENTKAADASEAQKKEQILKVLTSLQRMIRMAREHNIDPATNPSFAAKLQEHYDFLGLNASLEAAKIAEEGGDFNNVGELEPLQLQKVRWSAVSLTPTQLYFIYATELSQLSGISTKGVLDPQGVSVSPAHLPKFTASEYANVNAHYEQTGRILVRNHLGEAVEFDQSLSGVSLPSLEQLALGLALRLVALLRKLREDKVPGDQERTLFFIRALANVAEVTSSALLSQPVFLEFENYPGLLPQSAYTRMCALAISTGSAKVCLDYFDMCKKAHNGHAEADAYNYALMALSLDRTAQEKLLSEMDKVGIPQSERVFEAVAMGHVLAADDLRAAETLLAARQNNYKVPAVHSHHIASIMARGINATIVYNTILSYHQQDVPLDYNVLDEAFSYLKRAKQDKDAEHVMRVRAELHPGIPHPAELSTIPIERRVLAENAIRLQQQWVNEGHPLPRRPATEPVKTQPKNLDDDLMDLHSSTPHSQLFSGSGPVTQEAQARRQNPEWFASKEEPLVNEAVLKSMSDLPKDLAAKIRHAIDTAPPDELADSIRSIVLDELDKFKETTKLSHEIEAIRTVLENQSKPDDEDPLERDQFLLTTKARLDLTDDQVLQMRALLQVDRSTREKLINQPPPALPLSP